jgi:hypothetical protein
MTTSEINNLRTQFETFFKEVEAEKAAQRVNILKQAEILRSQIL